MCVYVYCAMILNLRNHCLTQGYKDFSPKNVIILVIIFRDTTHFELISVYLVKCGMKFCFLHMGIQLFQHHLLKTVLSPLNYLCSTRVLVCWWACVGLFFYSDLFTISILMSHCHVLK